MPTPLPTAVPPDDSPGTWAIGFRYEFPPNFWPVGEHRYGFNIRCPGLEEVDFAGEWRFFQVSEQVPPQPMPIYLRVQGLSAQSFSAIYLPNPVINPAQATTAVIYLVGLSEQNVALAASDCEALIAWDVQLPQPLTAETPFQP